MKSPLYSHGVHNSTTWWALTWIEPERDVDCGPTMPPNVTAILEDFFPWLAQCEKTRKSCWKLVERHQESTEVVERVEEIDTKVFMDILRGSLTWLDNCIF